MHSRSAFEKGGADLLTDRLYRYLGALPTVQAQARRIVKKLPHRLRVVERRGQRLIVDPSELSGFYLYYEREYDDFVFNFFDKIIYGYSTAFDIGANIGAYTCYFAARVDRVIAFEPEPSLCAWLGKNIALNSLTNVVVHEACVGLADGAVDFFPADKRNFGTGNIVAGTGTVIQRPCTSLDKLMATASFGPSIIKMDIEGAEWLALQGARQVLTRPDLRVDLLIEIHPKEIEGLGGSTQDLRELLLELGYSTMALTPQGLHSFEPSGAEQRFWWVTRQPRLNGLRPMNTVE
jgi:FkbM family methyltransferase